MEPKPDPHKRYICSFPGCAAAYNKQWKLDAHLCKHTGVRPHTCTLPGCGKSFSRQYHLARHELSHSGAKPFRCTVDGCAVAFTTNANRTRHVNRVHASEPKKKYACTFEGCGLEFRKNQQLKTHVCEEHTHTAPYPCPHPGCNMAFTVPSKLKRHDKVHRGYPCKEEGCAFVGKTWTEYLKHRQAQHRLWLQCDQCGRAFKDSWFLQQHRQVHASTRRVLRCPRDGCGRSFTTAYNLQSHISAFHDELRPFTCAHSGCGRTFVMKQGLQRHAATHNPDRKEPRRRRPKRSMASRLSGYRDVERKVRGESVQKAELPEPVELVCLLQDTTLVHGPAADAGGHMAHVLKTPLTT